MYSDVTTSSKPDDLDRSIKLHVVYRACGRENKKGRPDYYSKYSALASLLRSLEQSEGDFEITFLTDGLMPSDILRTMERRGEVVSRQNLGCAGSMRAALALIGKRRYGTGDIVFLSEDDHLYAPSAFGQLLAAARQMPEADYFGLYASIGHRAPDGKVQPAFAHLPRAWRPSKAISVEGRVWCRGLSTTSSFGARPQALQKDSGLMRLAMRSGGAWDHTTCLMYQGFLPFPWTDLTSHFGPASSWRRRLQSVAIRTAMNGAQILRRASGQPLRTLVAADPPLATHLETEHLAVGTDWSMVAAECADWGNRESSAARSALDRGAQFTPHMVSA